MFTGTKELEPSWLYSEHILTADELQSLHLLDRLLWIAPMRGNTTIFNFWEAENGGTKKGTPIQLWKRTTTNRRRLNWEIQSVNPGNPANQLFVFGYKPIDDTKPPARWLSINDHRKAVLTGKKADAQKFYIQRLGGNYLGAEINPSIGQYMLYPVDKDGNGSVLRPLGTASGSSGNSTKITTVDIDIKAAGWRYTLPRWRFLKVHETGEDQPFRTHENMVTSFFGGAHPEHDYNLVNTEIGIQLKASYLFWQVFARKDANAAVALYSAGTPEGADLHRKSWQIEPASSGKQDFLISTKLNGKKRYVCAKDGKLRLGSQRSSTPFRIRIAGYDTSRMPFGIKLFLYDTAGKQVIQCDNKNIFSDEMNKTVVRFRSVGKLLDPFERELSLWDVWKSHEDT